LQLDVVIVNDSSPRLTIDSSNSIIAPILADSVLSVIEVKTSLTADQLKKALSQMRPVKALMTTHSTLITPDGRVVEDPLDGKIITGIFSFNPGSNIEYRIPSIVALYPGVIDFIVLPDDFGFFSVDILRVCGISINESEILNGFVKYSARGMGLAMVFGILNSLAATRRFSGANCIRYLNGYWGGPSEEFNRIASNTEKYLNSMNKIVAKNNDIESKKQFYYSQKQFSEKVNDFSNLLKKDHK